MSSSKVFQKVPSTTTEPAVGRITRSKAHSAKECSSIIQKGLYIILHTPTPANTTLAEKQTTSSRAPGDSHQALLMVASQKSNEPKSPQFEWDCFLDPTYPNKSDPIENMTGLQIKPKATERKAFVTAKNSFSTRVTPYTRVPWNAKDVNELRRLMSMGDGYPSVEDRKKWAAILNK
jgi:hypothetical protein